MLVEELGDTVEVCVRIMQKDDELSREQAESYFDKYG